MVKHFFVIGMPRSRTSWLANFLTSRHSFCYHEALNICPSLTHLFALLNHRQDPFVGNSDGTTAFFIDRILERYPEAKLVVIKRPTEEVTRSLDKMGLHTPKKDLERCQEGLSYVIAHHHPLVVDFADLSEKEICRAIWHHCLEDEPFDCDRWEMLNKLQVQPKENFVHRDMPGILKNFAALRGEL